MSCLAICSREYCKRKFCANTVVRPSHSRDVFRWYEEDHKAHPTIFPKVHESYFNATWREYASDIKLHRWLRFTKCDTCDRLRTQRWNTKLSMEEREAAQQELLDHYKFVKAERALAESKKIKAMLQPHKYLSLALDGTDQLPNGLPQFRYRSFLTIASREAEMPDSILQGHYWPRCQCLSSADVQVRACRSAWSRCLGLRSHGEHRARSESYH